MKKIFVVFGSASDENVALPLVEQLKGAGCDVEYAVISAHRNLEQLREKMAGWAGDAVVAGAGLAAALPGVVAAMTGRPVIGLPVAAQFGGIDSFASIAQMPPGVPVLCSGANDTQGIADFVNKWDAAKPFNAIHFVVPQGLDAKDVLAKGEAVAADKNLTVTSSAEPSDSAFNIFCVSAAGHIQPEAFGLHLPVMPASEAAKPENYLRAFEWAARGGLWVGVNNARNAVHGAARLKGAS